MGGGVDAARETRDDHGARRRFVLTEGAFARRAQGREMARVKKIGIGLDHVLGAHSGVRQDRDQVPPHEIRLGVDSVRHATVVRDRHLAGDVQPPGAGGGLDGMVVMAERPGYGCGVVSF